MAMLVGMVVRMLSLNPLRSEPKRQHHKNDGGKQFSPAPKKQILISIRSHYHFLHLQKYS
jgi:hypothetical protein